MSLGIAMKDLLFAVWKNSSRPKIGQFELVRCWAMLRDKQDWKYENEAA